MRVLLGDKLRTLRERRSVTQAELADFIGADCREVIKWESGEAEPSLQMLAKLALYFNISSDKLIGMENFSSEDRIREYLEKCQELVAQSKLTAARDTLREALHHFPDNWRFKCMLMYTLYLSCDGKTALRQYTSEICSIFDDITRSCPDDEIRAESKRVMALHQSLDLGDREGAVRTALLLPARSACREELLLQVTSGPSHEHFLKLSILDSLATLCRDAQQLAGESSDQSVKLECHLSVWRAASGVISDKVFLALSPVVYQSLAELVRLRAEREEYDLALEMLDEAATLACRYDEFSDGDAYSTAPLSGIKIEREDETSLRDKIVRELLPAPYLTPVQYDTRLTDICARLAKS